MRMTGRDRGRRLRVLPVAWLTLGLVGTGTIRAQVPAPSPPAASREVELEERLRKMEAMNRRMAEQFDAMVEQNKALGEQFKAVADENKALATKVDALTKRAGGPSESGDGGGVAKVDDDRSPDDGQPGDIRTDEPKSKRPEIPTRSSFGDGFRWETDDGEFQFQLHGEVQFDTRVYEQRDSDPVNPTGFTVPRARFFFNGRLTKPIEYSFSINKGLSTFDLLDAYINFNYDKRFQIRVGRFRVPFTYDFYALSNQFLTAPERSLFAINYGLARNTAVMGHGELFGDRVDYAIAGLGGPRNSYFDTNAHKDLVAYVNYRPFFRAERLQFLKHLNVGGSVAYGIEDQAPLPIAFRTSANASMSAGALETIPPFLTLNDDVVERGRRQMGEVHLAYYFKGLTLMGAYEAGFNDYARGDSRATVRLPTHGFHVATGYFLTGEQVERRTIVEPLRPFDLRKGRFGLGAVELQARYSAFSVGEEVFTGGLADPDLWTNRVYAVDSGFNWYLNRYVKVYFDWQHSVFEDPVRYRPGALQKTSDLFWLRCQFYF